MENIVKETMMKNDVSGCNVFGYIDVDKIQEVIDAL